MLYMLGVCGGIVFFVFACLAILTGTFLEEAAGWKAVRILGGVAIIGAVLMVAMAVTGAVHMVLGL